MTQNTSFDAFAFWKDLYDKTESAWHDVIQETLGKESFAEGLGQIQGQYLQYQELVNKMTESYLKQANMPSREEIANVASLIINLETKIDDLEDQLDTTKESTSKEIDQLKKTVSNLDKKLDKIVDLLSKSEGTKTVAKSPTSKTSSTPAKSTTSTSANTNN